MFCEVIYLGYQSWLLLLKFHLCQNWSEEFNSLLEGILRGREWNPRRNLNIPLIGTVWYYQKSEGLRPCECCWRIKQVEHLVYQTPAQSGRRRRRRDALAPRTDTCLSEQLKVSTDAPGLFLHCRQTPRALVVFYFFFATRLWGSWISWKILFLANKEEIQFLKCISLYS